jgi:replicative DNA helicase
MTLKVQPHSEEAEKALLGSILIGGSEVFETCKHWIRHSDAFYSDYHKKIWIAMHRLYRDREGIDCITVVDKFKRLNPDTDDKKGITYYITGLPDETPSSALVEKYSKIVWEKYLRRSVSKSANTLYNTVLQDDNQSMEEIVGEHIRLLEEIKNIQPTKLNDIEDIVEETRELVNTGDNIIRFGLPALDIPAGGMTRKEITVLGGRPGHGKTTLVVNIIRSLVEQGNKVMMFNREMSNPEMIRKLVVMEGKNLSYSKVRKGDLNGTTDEFNQSIEKIKSKYKDNLIMFDDVSSLDEAMLEISRNKPDVIIDDYIQLIAMPDKQERRFQIEKIVQDYKWICKKENCSALLVSQLNRDIEKRYEPRPRLSDYSESGVIEQTAESALFVWYGYVFNDEEYSPYQSEIISAKTRYGKVMTEEVGFNGDRCRFYKTKEEALEDTPKQ